MGFKGTVTQVCPPKVQEIYYLLPLQERQSETFIELMANANPLAAILNLAY